LVSAESSGVRDEGLVLLAIVGRVLFPCKYLHMRLPPPQRYFTSSTSGTLLRKNKLNLTSARIEEEFTKCVGRSLMFLCVGLGKWPLHSLPLPLTIHHRAVGDDVVAAYLTLPNVFMEEETSLKSDPEGEGGSSIEYLDRQGLHEFLYRRRKDCGILQRFVEPKVH
jgi:hypothetical protein